ncbi:hypothetical protein GUY61_19565 [Streptomyces sp. GC420]|nr:hypothetical protein [Streptomyces sp. GC420]
MLRRGAVRTVALAAALTALLPLTAARAEPAEPGEGAAPPAPAAPAVPASGGHSVADLLTDLRELYRRAGEATEEYNATEVRLRRQRAEAERLGRRLAATRVSLHRRRTAAGLLARQQYRGTTGISAYVRLLLADDPQRALEQGHVLQRAAAGHAAAIARLRRGEKDADTLATRSRKALDKQQFLTAERKRLRDTVNSRLREVEELLAALTPRQLDRLRELEPGRTRAASPSPSAPAAPKGTAGAPGAPGTAAPKGPAGTTGTAGATGTAPSRQGAPAVEYAVGQLGKPCQRDAEGPDASDCPDLPRRAWLHAGRKIPRTSQEQWAGLPRVPLDELRPGDVVVYLSRTVHVGLYVGAGVLAHAPRPGAEVKASPLASHPVLGAVRPDKGARPLKSWKPPALPRSATDGPDTGSGTPTHRRGAKPGTGPGDRAVETSGKRPPKQPGPRPGH